MSIPCHRQLHRTRGRTAFTLVEVMVVIAVIAVLVAMLMPALERARDAARNVLCMSNARQTAMSVLVYAGDFKGRAPIHWGRNFENPTAPLYQSTKAPDNRWMILSYYGKMRAGLTFPDYNNGRTFYCPTDETYFFEKNVHTAGGRGLAHYPNTAWNGQYYFSYLFPAVRTPETDSNRGGLWTGEAPYYWTTQSFWHFANYFRNAMIAPTVNENVELHNAMLWDRNELHDRQTASVAYWDGSVLAYGAHERIYSLTYGSYGSRGFNHPQILNWLRRWRLERYIP